MRIGAREGRGRFGGWVWGCRGDVVVDGAVGGVVVVVVAAGGDVAVVVLLVLRECERECDWENISSVGLVIVSGPERGGGASAAMVTCGVL